MNTILKLVLFIIVLGFFYNNNGLKEHYNGALIQLMAKGPQDTYLTGDAEKWMRYYYPYSYGFTNFVWNNPTRYPYYPRYSGLYPHHARPYFIRHG